jgi:hypothetical protein
MHDNSKIRLIFSMTVHTILKMGDPRLLRTAKPVIDFDTDALHFLISDMLDTMRAANGAGLAAPQIGVDLQVVIFGSNDRNPRYPDRPLIPPTVLINPVINLSTEQRFINVIDLYKRMEDSTNQELALVHAANLSELFPFMSASAHIPKLGNYADASYCENYGLKTAFEIYQACQDWKKSKAQDSLAAKCNFYVVALMNTHPTYSANSPNLPMEKSVPSETMAPLIAIGNVVLSYNPFSTREEIKSVLPEQVYHEMILNRSNLPLTRVLTKKNMRTMDSIRGRELKVFQGWYGLSQGK